MRIWERKESFLSCKEISYTCEVCGMTGYGPRDKFREAIDEHRRVHHADKGSHATIWTPRA